MKKLSEARKLNDLIKGIVLQVLEENRLLTGQWHLGVVDEVISIGKLKVFVDGSDTSQTITCNPDVNFQIGDDVRVIFINGNPRDKFVLCRRIVN